MSVKRLCRRSETTAEFDPTSREPKAFRGVWTGNLAEPPRNVSVDVMHTQTFAKRVVDLKRWLDDPNPNEYLTSSQRTPNSLLENFAKSCVPPELRLLENRPDQVVIDSWNLWVGGGGKKSSTTSSGLHHDFHDNLYVLLKGKKKFELYPPNDWMETFGTISKFHESSGLRNYEETGGITTAEGVPLDFAAITSYYVAQADADENEDDVKLERAAELAYEKAEVFLSKEDYEWPYDDLDDEGEECGGHPPNFVTPTSIRPMDKITIELNQGDALFVPCGWFHEVFSEVCGDENVHVAVNCWAYPPGDLPLEVVRRYREVRRRKSAGF